MLKSLKFYLIMVLERVIHPKIVRSIVSTSIFLTEISLENGNKTDEMHTGKIPSLEIFSSN